ncbi:hypothetical protein GPECTOR_33g588 [Gonium pectorale]|uniref:Uncharacterized protein n=1 Tax=Gonium pectorale TaxID=33097 RepID=A0A150GCY8_GONPE|nr:hypothetical protein GPECTOR_33g588 [Gonium pectorale]|eukprot:KXZ47706.1 hypothetical protein GPECTOR_33g588 [Gonium pectorale]
MDALRHPARGARLQPPGAAAAAAGGPGPLPDRPGPSRSLTGPRSPAGGGRPGSRGVLERLRTLNDGRLVSRFEAFDRRVSQFLVHPDARREAELSAAAVHSHSHGQLSPLVSTPLGASTASSSMHDLGAASVPGGGGGGGGGSAHQQHPLAGGGVGGGFAGGGYGSSPRGV